MAGMWIGLGLRGCLFADGRRSVLMAARSPCGPQAALRIEEKHTGRNDLLPFLQTRSDLDAIRQLRPYGDGPRLESVADGDEHVLLQAGVHDGVSRNRDHVLTG